MKREDKNEQTRQKILDAAICEFAAKGYDATSLNKICQIGSLSKGIIYHYFDSKDGLYLAVVEEAFKKLSDFLVSFIDDESDDILEQYFEARMAFFKTHKVYADIMFDATVTPPPHLQEKIPEKRKAFDALNDNYLKSIIRENPIRPDLSEDEILRVFHQFNHFFNSGYRKQGRPMPDIRTHEKDSRNALNIFLYGIIERK